MSRDPQYQRLLNSKTWKMLRMAYLQQHPLCERCLDDGHVRSAIDVHHRTPVETAHSLSEMRDLCYDLRNLEALCIPCHQEVHKEMGKSKRENIKERKNIKLQRWIDKQTKKPGSQ
jgi:5-methylcytosine-specific restriction protein A